MYFPLCRRAYLCGEDPVPGENYEHRKPWVVEKLKELSEVFAIEVCAYGIMSNHYHVILHVNAHTVKI
jgi:REP element-mobilizing transposase RayT